MTTTEIDHPIDPEHALCDAALIRVFEVLGKRWNGVILGSLAGGPESFSSLSRTVRGISDSVLSDRLSALAEAGLLDRTVCPGPPVAVIYKLTTKGRALMPGLTELTRWAEQYPC